MNGGLATWVSGTLRIGTAASALVIAVGLVLGMDPLTSAGLLLLTLTPLGELVVASAAFARQGERRYATIAAGACALLVGALLVALLLATELRG